MELKIKKKSIIALFFVFLAYLSYFVQSLFPMLIIIAFSYSSISKSNYIYLIFSFFLSALIFLVDVKFGMQFLTICLLVFLVSYYASDKYIYILKWNAIFGFSFLMFLVFFCNILYGDKLSIYSLQVRFFPILPNGDIVNPNFIGFICVFILFYFVITKNYILSIFPFWVLMMCQSRSSIMMLVVMLIIWSGLRLKNIIIFLLIFIIGYFFVINSTLKERFSTDSGGEDLRQELYPFYFNIIKNNFPYSINSNNLEYYLKNIGPLDNFYLLISLKFGVMGLVFLLLLWVFALKNGVFKNKIAFSVFLGFMVLGLVEGSILIAGLYMLLFSSALLYRGDKVNGVLE